jgi:hypothetical protein
VRDIVQVDSKELKAMMRQDLQRIESLMATSFDHNNKSVLSVGSGPEEGGRKSLAEIPSLRQSLESQRASNP